METTRFENAEEIDNLSIKEKVELAENSSDEEILDQLSECKDYEMEAKYGYPRDEWNDEEGIIREAVALNPNTSLRTLKKLASDPNETVLHNLLDNNDLPSDALCEIMYRYTEGDDFLERIIDHNNFSETVLREAVVKGMRECYRSFEYNREKLEEKLSSMKIRKSFLSSGVEELVEFAESCEVEK